MARKLIVELVGDTSSLDRALVRSAKNVTLFTSGIEKQARRTQGIFRGLTSGLGLTTAGLGLAGAVATVKKVTDEASDLNEAVNRTNVLFGKSADSVVAWSKTTANAIGLSSAAALEGAGNFGGMLETAGVAGDKAALMSRQLVQLASDMASFNDQDPSEMLDRIRSGLAGEAEPLRRFSVLISEARVQQEAYRSGIAKAGAKLTEQQKVLARYNLILRDTGPQQGDFARTAEAWANVQRRLNAVLQDTGARIGASLTPKLAELGDRLADWLSNTENQERVQRIANETIRKTGVVLQTLGGWIEKATEIWNGFQSAVEGITFVLFKVQMKAQQFAVDLKGAGIEAALGFIEPFSHIPRFLGGGWAQDLKKTLTGAADAAAAESARVGALIADNYGQGFQKGIKEAAPAVKKAAAALTPSPAASPSLITGNAGGAAAAGATAARFDAMINRQLDRVQDIPTLKGQISRLKQIARLIQQRMSVTKDIMRRLSLEDKLLEVQRIVRGDQAQIRQDAADAAKLARQAAIDDKMGWLDFAVEQAEVTKTIKDDVKAQQNIIAYLKTRMRQEGRTLEIVSGIWRARQKIIDLNKSKSDVDPLAGLMQVSSSRLAGILAAGTGLDARGRRILGANIAGAEIQPLHVHVNIDGREVGRAVTKDQARTGRRTASQTSGRRG